MACSAGMLFVETSAKTSANVSEVFESLGSRLSGSLPTSTNAQAY